MCHVLLNVFSHLKDHIIESPENELSLHLLHYQYACNVHEGVKKAGVSKIKINLNLSYATNVYDKWKRIKNVIQFSYLINKIYLLSTWKTKCDDKNNLIMVPCVNEIDFG